MGTLQKRGAHSRAPYPSPPCPPTNDGHPTPNKQAQQQGSSGSARHQLKHQPPPPPSPPPHLDSIPPAAPLPSVAHLKSLIPKLDDSVPSSRGYPARLQRVPRDVDARPVVVALSEKGKTHRNIHTRGKPKKRVETRVRAREGGEKVRERLCRGEALWSLCIVVST